MDHVVVDAVGADDHVADVLGVERDLHFQGIFHRPHRGHGMHRGADAADTLGIGPGVSRDRGP